MVMVDRKLDLLAVTGTEDDMGQKELSPDGDGWSDFLT